MKTGERHLSRRDLYYLVGLTHSALSPLNTEGCRSFILGLGQLIPFDFAIAARFSSSSPIDSYHAVNVSYPPAWLDLYLSRRFDRIDPILREHLANPRVQFWTDTYRRYSDTPGFVSLSNDFGLTAGYSFGLRTDDGRTTSLCSLSARSMRRDPRTEYVVSYAAPIVDILLDRSSRISRGQSIPLSKREVEVLQWAAEGKSNWETSRILRVSEETVKTYVKRVLRKLNARNKGQAVAAAIERRLIGPS